MDIISPVARENADLRPVAGPEAAGAAVELSILDRNNGAQEAPGPNEINARAPLSTGPIRVHGKFFFDGDTKHFVRGVPYGPFAVGTHRAPFPERTMVERDFALMRGAGVTTVRVFTVPPLWLLD